MCRRCKARHRSLRACGQAPEDSILKGDTVMRHVTLFSAMLAFLLGMADASRAQTATGQITGTVKDTNGAVIAKVKVTVNSQLTGVTREAVTNDSGDYVFPL